MKKHILNIDDVELVPRPAEYAPTGAAADVFAASRGQLGQPLGATKLGCNLTAVPPGKAAYPFHSHRINDEMFFVLAGEGEVRIGEERFPIRQGDVISCPAGGPESAHQIRNTGSVELRYLSVSSQLSPDICDYPDSGKFAVFADFPAGADGKPREFYFMGRESAMLDYWDGEGEAP